LIIPLPTLPDIAACPVCTALFISCCDCQGPVETFKLSSFYLVGDTAPKGYAAKGKGNFGSGTLSCRIFFVMVKPLIARYSGGFGAN
jgi:hypothetical protein